MNAEEYAKEFDEQVKRYNEYLQYLKDNPIKKTSKWKGFLEGMADLLGVFWISDKPSYIYEIPKNPLYSREDLSPEQKDAIAVGSDYQRTKTRLNKIISGETIDDRLSPEEIEIAMEATNDVYDFMKNVYVSLAMKK